MKTFSIYGDNIVECERMLALIRRALGAKSCTISGSVIAPTFILDTDRGKYLFNFYPGFGRWEQDVVAAIRHSGGVLRENPDVFITDVDEDQEQIILAVEFCNALPAGNQAWQRSGRAYSVARAGIPYLFVTEIGGYELDAMRNKKAPRIPNPAVPFSFISYSESEDSDAMVAYEMNPGADSESKVEYGRMVAGEDLPKYIAARLEGQDVSEYASSIGRTTFSFVLSAASERKVRVAGLDADGWRRVNEALQRDGDASELYRAFDIPWKKKTSIQTKPSFQKFLSGVEEIASALVSGDLPFCVVRSDKSPVLIDLLKSVYPDFLKTFPVKDIVGRDIALCFINGFKPHGDDARPDRGLLPLLRMLIGDSIMVLTIVYGPATLEMTEKLVSAPQELAKDNGLWEAVLSLSDYVVCDSMRNASPVVQRGWAAERLRSSRGDPARMKANTSHRPLSGCEGENDVDSALHVLFAHVLGGRCFEAMCNPPGGDWSGISLLFNGMEYRWLTLPRVSTSGSKRPDHVIQANQGTVLAIESKDVLSNIEQRIGPRLNRYCADLFGFMPSCVRSPTGEWSDNVEGFELPDMTYVSACAFMECRNEGRKRVNVLSATKTDVAFAVSFNEDHTTIKIMFAKKCDEAVRSLFRDIRVPEGLKLKVFLE